VKSWALFCYCLFVVWVSFVLVTAPAEAFRATEYARVVHQAEQIAFAASQKSAIAATVGAAAAASSPAAVAIRFVAGPAGWAALGLSVALTLAEVYYSGSDLQTVKEAASAGNPDQITINGEVVSGTNFQSSCGSMTVGCSQSYLVYNGLPIGSCFSSQATGVPTGWSGSSGGWDGACSWQYSYTYNGANAANMASVAPAPATEGQIASYVSGLPAEDPASVESHTVPKGQGASPSSPATTEAISVTPAQMPSSVVPKPVANGDAVVADNVPPPAETPQQSTVTQTSTTTTTTDGDTTEESTEATVSCNGATHDERTLRSIWETHKAQWGDTGVGSLLNVFKTITWPDALGSISFDFSHVGFGTYVLDFNNYAAAFTAGKAVMLFVATFTAYRIVFGGGG